MIRAFLAWFLVSGLTYVGLLYSGNLMKRWKMLLASIGVGLVSAAALTAFVLVF